MFLVLVTSACGGSVGLGDLFDGGTAGSSGSSTGSTSSSSGSGSGTTSGSGSGTSGSTSGTSGSGTSGSTSGSGSGSTSATTGGPDPATGTTVATTGAGGANPAGTTTVGTGGRPGTGGAGGAGGSSGSNQSCGGFTGTRCPAGTYCDYPDGSCGAADQTGVCRVNTGIGCTADCPGVCGCDGKFYCNSCNAAIAGTDVTSNSSCSRDAGPTPDPIGKRCGGLAGATCDANSYCDFPGSGCGIADASGVCQPKPQVCTTDCPGVCGCDGKFYCNACGAAGVGVDVNPSNTTCPRPF